MAESNLDPSEAVEGRQNASKSPREMLEKYHRCVHAYLYAQLSGADSRMMGNARGDLIDYHDRMCEVLYDA